MKLINIPQKIKQPNSEVIDCYASGDEYFNWLHDKNGHIIIQNVETGYYSYAKYIDGELLSSDYIVTLETINNPDINNIYKELVTIDDIKLPLKKITKSR